MPKRALPAFVRGFRVAWQGAMAAVTAAACVSPGAPSGSPSEVTPAAQTLAPLRAEGPRPEGARPATARAPIVDWPPVVMRCLQTGDTCGGSAETCRALVARPQQARDEAARCFDPEACDASTACFRAFLASHPQPGAAPPSPAADGAP